MATPSESTASFMAGAQAYNMGQRLGMDRQRLALERQQQASQESDRRIRERKLMADLDMLELEKQKLTAEIEQRALQDAADLEVNTQLRKEQTAFQTARELGDQQPEQDWLRRGAALATQIAPTSPRTQDLLKTVSALDTQRSLISQRETSALEEERLRSQIRASDASADLSNARKTDLATGKAYTKPELEKLFDVAAKAGQPYTPKQQRDAIDVHLGLKAKEGTATAPPSEEVWVSRHFQDFISTRPKKLVNGKSEYLTDEQALEVLHDRYNKIMRKADKASAPAPASSSPIRVRSKSTGRLGWVKAGDPALSDPDIEIVK